MPPQTLPHARSSPKKYPIPESPRVPNYYWLIACSILVAGAIPFSFHLWPTRSHHQNNNDFALVEPAFEVVDIPGRGKGMVATRDIEVSYHLSDQQSLFSYLLQQGESVIR